MDRTIGKSQTRNNDGEGLNETINSWLFTIWGKTRTN